MDPADLAVLLVEDHDFQRWTIEQGLRRFGVRSVVAAENGRSGLQALATSGTPFDLVMSDLDMPDMDGLEFIRHLGALQSNVALVILSAQPAAVLASVEAMARAYGVNILGVLSKPLELALLKATLEGRPGQSTFAGRRQQIPFTREELAAALGHGQITSAYQPKVDLRGMTATGAEALARWIHPHHGPVAPTQFVSAMEREGMADLLLCHMLGQAAAACAAWRREGLHVSIAVNVSLSALSTLGLAERLTEIVAGEAIEPDNVVLELTETAATSDAGPVLENLSRLRMKGFGLSIDDFGTGYSSMERLTRVPFTELKIDQSFVQRALSQPACMAVVQSSVDMASRLGLAVVAEGVETREQVDYLSSLGCSVGQGYFFGRPMSADRFVAHVRELGA